MRMGLLAPPADTAPDETTASVCVTLIVFPRPDALSESLRSPSSCLGAGDGYRMLLIATRRYPQRDPGPFLDSSPPTGPFWGSLTTRQSQVDCATCRNETLSVCWPRSR